MENLDIMNNEKRVVLNDISEIKEKIIKIKNRAKCSNGNVLITAFVLINPDNPKQLVLKQYRIKGKKEKC